MDIHLPTLSRIQDYTKLDGALWAHVVSFILSPSIVWTGWFFSLAFYFELTNYEAIVHATIFSLCVCWIPASFVFYMVKIGKIGDIHIRENRERYAPYVITITGTILALILLIYRNAHPVLIIVSLNSCVQLTLMFIGTFFDHISIHTMAITSVTLATATIFGVNFSLYFLPMILLIVLSRLVLRRHNTRQIILGVLIGMLPPLGVILLLAVII